MMIGREEIESLARAGGDVLNQDGEKIGGIGELYVNDETEEAAWVTVRTGLFGTKESFVPVDGASLQGSDLLVPYTKDQVKDAPRVAPDGHLEPHEEDRLYSHYSHYSRTGQGTETRTEEETVTEEVAKEHIETDGVDEGRGRP